MRKPVAAVAIVAIIAIVAAGYGGGRWIGSFVEIGLDHSTPVRVGGAGHEGMPRGRAEAEAAARVEAQARRAAMEAARAAAERRAQEGVWSDATCADWSAIGTERQLHTTEELVVGLLEEVRNAESLGAGATFPEIAVAAHASLGTACQGSVPGRGLTEVVAELYGGH